MAGRIGRASFTRLEEATGADWNVIAAEESRYWRRFNAGHGYLQLLGNLRRAVPRRRWRPGTPVSGLLRPSARA